MSLTPVIWSYNLACDPRAKGCISHHEVISILKIAGRDNPLPALLNTSINLGLAKEKIFATADGICLPRSGDKFDLLATWDELQDIVEKYQKGQAGCYILYDDGSKPWRVSILSASTGMPAMLSPPLKESGIKIYLFHLFLMEM